MEPYCLSEIEDLAKVRLGKREWVFLESGAGDERTTKRNVTSFGRYTFRPKRLTDVSDRSMNTTVLGKPISLPVCLGPSSMQKLMHPLGEVATAKAAQSINTCYATSMLTSMSLADISQAAPSVLKWFQMTPMVTDELTDELVQQAIEHGYGAILMSLDSVTSGRRVRLRKYSPSPIMYRIELYENVIKKHLPPHIHDTTTLNWMRNLAWTWDDLAKFRQRITLPLVVKGILTGEDATRAVECGVDGILVSNQGGRKIDDLPASIDVLSEIVDAVNGRCEVYIDGGIRSGRDVIKALALGARAVFLGRPPLWGLAYNGEDGVKKVFDILREEIDNCMAMIGCRTLNDITRDMVRKESYGGYCNT